jgi:putative ABC transport system substrate-binding protein
VLDIGRREFITLLGAAAWPLAARAQQAAKVWRIGILETISSAQNAPQFDAFLQRLQQLGYVEGQNLVIEYRSAEGRGDQFRALAAELIQRNVDLIDEAGNQRYHRELAANRSGARKTCRPDAPECSIERRSD